MTGQRPDPVLMAEAVRNLADLHHALTEDIAHTRTTGASEKVTKSEGTEHPAPGNWTAVSVRADIHHTAHHYVRMLLEDRPRTTANLDGTIETLTELIAIHIGYFTSHQYANIATAFHDDIKEITYRAVAVIEPDDAHKTPIGPCAEPECHGVYEIVWHETEGDDDVRAWRLSNSRRMATCKTDATHRIDAMIYAAGAHA